MGSWNQLVDELERQTTDEAKTRWLKRKHDESLRKISEIRNGRNVIYYSSSFLNKPTIPPFNLQITHEEINGFMSVMYGMNWDKGLTLILHTPGGVTNAAETIVSYLHSKFNDIEVIVPTYSMSAGTMIALASNKIIMGRQSQLGPIDPQMPVGGGRFVSAMAIVDQFKRAKKELNEDIKNAHIWAPILQSLGPALLQEAQNALDYSEQMVRNWLSSRMFSAFDNPQETAAATAEHFNKTSLSHGRRIDRSEARANNVIIEDLEDDQELQEWVLTAYHLMSIVFEKTPASKILLGDHGRAWVKNVNLVAVPHQQSQAPKHQKAKHKKR